MEDDFDQNWMYRVLAAGKIHQENERFPEKNEGKKIGVRQKVQLTKERLTKYRLKDDEGQAKDVFGSGCLHHAVSSREIDFQLVKRIITDDPESARHRNQFGRLPLHYALDRTTINNDVILLLLRVYPEGANVEDHDHQTPYDLSLKWGHSRRIHRALLEACPSQDGQYLLQLRWGLLTPLIQLIQNFIIPSPPPQPPHHSENDHQLNPIIENQQPSQSLDVTGVHTPSSLAVLPTSDSSRKGSTQTEFGRLKALEDVEEERTKDVFGSGSLHHAVSSRNIELTRVKRIITDDPVSARHRNQFGRLPLHYALDRTTINVDVILLLLRVYPEGANVEDHDHQTPYDLSLKWGHSRRIHRALLEACPSQDGQYLLQLRWGLLTPLVLCLTKPSVTSTVEEERTNDVFGSGSLHHAVSSRDIELTRVKRIITDDPESARHPNQFGRLPLHYALDRTTINNDMILLLLRVYPEGANVEDHDHQTPYDLSLKWGHSRRIHRALLEACPSQDGQYLLQLRWGLLTPLVLCLIKPSPPPQAVVIPQAQSQSPQQSYQPVIDDHPRPTVEPPSPSSATTMGGWEDRPSLFIDIDIDVPMQRDTPPMQEPTHRDSNTGTTNNNNNITSNHITTDSINVNDVNHSVVSTVETTGIHPNDDNNSNSNGINILLHRQKPSLSICIAESPKRKRRRSFVFDPTDED